MKILVTGASGFIGRTLTARLLGDGHQVIGLGRSASFNLNNCDVVVKDIADFNDWRGLLPGFEVVVHLAGRAHILNDSSKDPLREFRRINVQGTINLAKHAAESGARRFIFLSSIGVNGNETHARPFSVSDTPNPCSPYAISKYEAELALKDLSKSLGLEIVIIRPPLVYGRQAPGNFRSMVKLIGTGIPLPLGALTTNRRSFIGLDNLVDLIAVCIDHRSAANNTFLVSDGEDISTTDLFCRLYYALKKKPLMLPIPPSIMHFFVVLIGGKDLARRLLGNLQINMDYTYDKLGWRPPFTVNEGFSRMTL